MLLKNLLPILVCSALSLAATTSLRADETDPDEASRLQTQGVILSLASILERIRPITGTNILEIEVEHANSGLAYEIYFLDLEGHRREIFVDARTGEILPQKLDD